MKHPNIIFRMSLEEKCYLLSGKDFWQSGSVKRLGIPNMALSDGPHGLRKQEGPAISWPERERPRGLLSCGGDRGQ